ncbi:putative E3 ubiquitin-protein ligase RHA4A [Tasmannia lanceolata]|uniref:putative E3 ubiquitin-protein ligase RHA4A n=1 Tax=Tasmannia lanceolata TaxID=3420 RepID=UPI00406374F9
MGLPHTPSSHPYPPSLQLKLYQAFIFSVPILFTIILFLLFYLFYLKRRRVSNLTSPPQMHPRQLNQAATVISLPFEMELKKELKHKLPVIIFDEDLRARDSQCCVCLGDFEIKEQLHQIPSCKHMFHVDCIHHWLMANATCPLCRASIIPLKMESPVRLDVLQQIDPGTNDSEQEHELDGGVERDSWNLAVVIHSA